MYAFIGCFLYVPKSGIELAILMIRTILYPMKLSGQGHKLFIYLFT